MPDLYPVTDDDLSEAELTNYIDFSNLTNYFETDCAYTPDHTNEEVTVNSGKAYVRDTGGDTYALEPDQSTLAFPNQTGVNYLYLTFDPTASPPESSVTWEISATDGGPADPKLKRAEIDASADSDTSFNDAPDTVVGDLTVNGTASGFDPGSTQADTGTITASGGSTPAADVTATNVTLNQDSDYWLLLYVDADPAFAADYGWNWEYSHNWDDTNSEVDLDFTVNWDTDPGAGNDVTLRWEVRQP